MGGGDLNLKKSWHPHTLKNQERVWKAEQAKQEEQRKLDDLRKEINSERDREELRRLGENSGVLAGRSGGEAKLEWMYKNSAELINREEYLLGRKIDKSFEKLQAEERGQEQVALGLKQSINHVEHECVPFSIREYRNLQSTEQVDMQRKTMEDPLMLIKQREMESRRKLLENPVKLKEIHRILKTEQEQAQASQRNKKSKKSKKSKKKKHKKGSSDDESDSNDDLDRKLARQMKKLKGDSSNSDFKLDKLLDAKYRTLSKQLDMATKHKTRKQGDSSADSDSSAEQPTKQNREHRERRNRDRGRDSSSDERKHRRERQQVQSSDRRRRSRSRSPRRDQQQHQRHSERSRERRGRSSTPDKRQRRNPSPPMRRTSPAPASSRHMSKSKPKLSETERETRLREMMDNATWREADRTKAVQKHRDAYAREEAQNQARSFDKQFINKEVKKAIDNQTSIGNRIRSNLNNIQRTSAAMDSSFTRK